jgi:hypothetical protein
MNFCRLGGPVVLLLAAATIRLAFAQDITIPRGKGFDQETIAAYAMLGGAYGGCPTWVSFTLPGRRFFMKFPRVAGHVTRIGKSVGPACLICPTNSLSPRPPDAGARLNCAFRNLASNWSRARSHFPPDLNASTL